MRRAVPAAACATVAALGLAAVTVTGASAGQRCSPAGARTLASDARVRVYTLPGPGPFQRSAYACLLVSSRTVALGVRGLPQVRVGPVALSGTLLAYATSTIGIDTSSASVSELDLAAAHPQLGSAPAASPPTRPESFSSVTDLRITARGSIAWIARTSGILQPVPVFEVRSRPRSRPVSLLARGPAVRPGSLRLQAGRVVWLDGAGAQSAALP